MTAGNLFGVFFFNFFLCAQIVVSAAVKQVDVCSATFVWIFLSADAILHTIFFQAYVVRSFCLYILHETVKPFLIKRCSSHFGFQKTIDSEWILDILGEAQSDVFADASFRLLCVVAHLCLCPGGAKAPKSDDDELVQRFSTP